MQCVISAQKLHWMACGSLLDIAAVTDDGESLVSSDL